MTWPTRSILSSGEFNASEEMSSQTQIFQARKASYNGSIDVLQQRIEQLQSKLVGQQVAKNSREELAASYAAELEDVKALLSQGFSDITRVRELERNYASFNGEAAELTAAIATTEVEIGEARLLTIQQEREFQNQVVSELGEVQTSLRDVTERSNALQDIVSRTVVRKSTRKRRGQRHADSYHRRSYRPRLTDCGYRAANR